MNKDLEGKELVDSVLCAYRKFSIGVNEYRNLVINYSSDCNCSKLQLYDLSIQDMRNLSEMFASLARKFEKD
jgi:hypothetical protein